MVNMWIAGKKCKYLLKVIYMVCGKWGSRCGMDMLN